VRQAAREARHDGGLRIDTNCDTALTAGDEGQLAQVLRNLIDNAIKYGRSDRPVHLSIEAVDSGWVSIAIRDEGEGIAPEHLPRLTERFYRTDASRSRAAGGTGLGLSIVKHIVERHRGSFNVTSRSGEGTTASLMLPLIQEGAVTKL
jgi:two-component system, OmpR family, phosphate regulon sensor histidine kinase PhoR